MSNATSNVALPAQSISPRLHALLPVRLLVPCTRTWAAELLWLTSSVVGYEECAVVCNESLLQLVLAVLVDVFLVVCDLNEYWR